MESEEDVSKSKCQFFHGDNGDAENSNGENDTPVTVQKNVPYQWWKFGLFNFIQLKRHGWNFYQHAMESNHSTVFSVKLDEWTTCVCDHVAMKSVLDLDKVERDKTGHGFLQFKPHMLREQIPCLWSNDEPHEIKKAFILRFVKDVYDNMPDKIVDVVRKEFEKMKPFKFANAKDAKESAFDCERMFIDAANNVTFFTLLGEYFEDTEPIDKWRYAVFQMEGIFGSAGDTVGMTNKVFDMFEPIKKLKDLSSKFEDSGLEEDEMFKEALFIATSNAGPGIQVYAINTLICYIRLPESDKELLRKDAEKFFSASNYRDVLPNLHHLHAFFMEVLRVHPLPVIYGRAKKDFVMKSTSGNFRIKKNDNLCGMPYFIHRDENLFEDPSTFNMHRPIKQTEKYNFGYGGYFYAKPSGSNHKCAGAMLSMEIVKIIVLFYTKCNIVMAEPLLFTATNIRRKFASEEPLAMLEFSYNRGD